MDQETLAQLSMNLWNKIYEIYNPETNSDLRTPKLPPEPYAADAMNAYLLRKGQKCFTSLNL